MNIQQQFIVVLVTCAIIMCIGIFLKFIENFVDKNTLSTETSKYLIGMMILFIWFFFVFISSLQMQINQLSKNLNKYQEQIHSDIMKRYIDFEDKCGKKLK